MRFTRLRLVGFKSFVEPSELRIEQGLTGIVGPNGCGKSNLVEALRWVMGETSARKMRGGGMDDVIFAGSGTRPARNLAEVALTLDNRAHDAPPQYNESEEIEVVRRIEREAGSHFRVNGIDVRARDVQRLFADVASGAHSTALVGQGEIGALIKAKPEDRRTLLEEAAGITGLHSRRHEAELRLRAAEANLERLSDVMTTLENQLQGLKKQARQASRYRNLSGHIRKAEAQVLYVAWQRSGAAVETAAARLADAQAEVAHAAEAAAAATTALAAAAERLPPLRQAEAEAAARVHRVSLAIEQLDEEEKRALAEQRELEARLAQIVSDIERETARVAEADEAVARLAEEIARLEVARADEGAVLAETAARVAAVRGEVATLDQQAAEATQAVATAEARRAALLRRREEATRRADALTKRHNNLRAERDALLPDGGEAAEPDVDALRADAEASRAALAAAEAALTRCQAEEAQARESLRVIDGRVARVAAEEGALAALLGGKASELWPPLVDAVQVTPGCEAALAAALGDDLNVAADTGAPVHWRGLEPYAATAALPEGAEPLSRYVEAPAVLARRLSQIGLVADEATGARLQPSLAQGQRLVTRDGALWRWDGFTVTTSGTTSALTRLNQRNRLRDLRAELAAVQPELAAARAGMEAAAAATAAAQRAVADGRGALRAADETLNAAREAAAEARRQAADRLAKLAAIGDMMTALTNESIALADERRTIEREMDDLPDSETQRRDLTELRTRLQQAREALRGAEAAEADARRDAQARRQRLEAASRERGATTGRAEAARRHLDELGQRRNDVAAAQAQVIDKPREIAERRARLLDEAQGVRAARTEAADRLASAEAEVAGLDRREKEAEKAAATAREAQIRREAEVSQADMQRTEVAGRIRERLDCDIADVGTLAEIPESGELPDADAVAARLQRLHRERETMGPVNLRAEEEAQTLSEQLESLQAERGDLEGAIARLRQGIGSLNREGRERLLAAFHTVNENFQSLFTELFGGGRAHLTLTDSEDPLEAGLEIMASPPGKRLQMLTLLSGGEQALTALSLLVAVFRTNPAPVCVLDEVDAPLDDANVARFCGLVGRIAEETGTRFLIITHNAYTMARMDRLYGVTMRERGISQLVSVDLARAETLRQTA